MGRNFLNEVSFYCLESENQFFDWKSARIKPLDIIRHLVAFANAEGGQLAIGIENDGKITGFNYDGAHKIDEYKNICFTELKETPLSVNFDVLKAKNENGKNDEILIISVDMSSDRVIKSHDGKVFLRQNDKSKELNVEQVIQLQYDRGQRFFEDEIADGAGLDDIDGNLLEDYKNIINVSELSNEEVLKARNFLINDKITNAGILLFGKNPSKFLPQARLRVIKYDGMYPKVGTEINIIKEKTFDGAIPNIIREAREFINAQLRDFQFLTQRYSRNPRIARILCEFGWVKEMNEGVKRIYSEMEKVFLNKPQYSEPNNNVLLVLENNIINRNIRTGDQIERVISKVELDKLNIDEMAVLYYMYNSGENMTTKRASELTTRGTTFCRKMLKNLERKKILKWIGTSMNDSKQYYVLNF